MRDERLQRYLAEHYYSGPKSEAVLARYGDGKKKKKKRSHADAPSVADAMTIRDPSSVWFSTPDDDADEEEMDETPVPAAPMHAETAPPASKSQQAGWTSVRAPTEPEAPPSAAGPPTAPAPDVPVPTTKPKAGLMTREQLKAQREAREAAERAAAEAEAEAQASAEPAPPPTETVYRDAQGRRINLEEEEARLKEEARQRALMEKERAQWNRGLVQRRAEAEQRAELATAQGERVTKYADDARWNESLREQGHWDDPARAFLRQRASRRATRPRYEGPAPPPNRFGIQPGYRWDGVDRSNGFERKLLVSINNTQRIQSEHHGTCPSPTYASVVRRGYVVPPHTHAPWVSDRRRGALWKHNMTSLSLPLPLVSPLATHIIELSNFSPALHTRDLHTLFAPWNNADNTVYRIKWLNDTTVYILFTDASLAKKAYLSLLSAPSPLLRTDYSGTLPQDMTAVPCARLTGTGYATVRPFDGPEAAALLAQAGIATNSLPALLPSSAWAPAPQTDAPRTHRRIVSSTAVPSGPSESAPRGGKDLPRTNSRRAVSGGAPTH